MHEIGHALGFSVMSWPLFRDDAGTARTQREPLARPSMWPKTLNNYYCPAGVKRASWSVENTITSPSGCKVDPPQFSESATKIGKDQAPCTFEISTPNVANQAKKHFKCGTLTGVPLENQPTTDCVLLGSHWEQRALLGELMTSTTTNSGSSYLSALTLAVFQDSGWYNANFSAATPHENPPLAWGLGAGCDFMKKPCLVNGKVNVKVAGRPHYCR